MSENTNLLPRLHAENLSDLIVVVAAGLWQTLLFLIAPAALAFWLTGSWILALNIVCWFSVPWVLFTVWALQVSPQGLRFVRAFGKPQFIPWTAVSSVELAPRSELILKGWLLPRFPMREMTFCFSSFGHYRIRYGDSLVYFPPADSARFEELVARHLQRGAHHERRA